jgi:hypothetical protein
LERGRTSRFKNCASSASSQWTTPLALLLGLYSMSLNAIFDDDDRETPAAPPQMSVYHGVRS